MSFHHWADLTNLPNAGVVAQLMGHILVPVQVPHFLNLQAVDQPNTCNMCRHVLEEVAYLSCMRLKSICACAWVWCLAYYSWWVKNLAEYLEAAVHAAAALLCHASCCALNCLPQSSRSRLFSCDCSCCRPDLETGSHGFS